MLGAAVHASAAHAQGGTDPGRSAACLLCLCVPHLSCLSAPPLPACPQAKKPAAKPAAKGAAKAAAKKPAKKKAKKEDEEEDDEEEEEEEVAGAPMLWHRLHLRW